MSSSSDKRSDSTGETETRAYGSPPCYQHEIDPNYLGIAAPDEKALPSTASSWSAVRTWCVKTRLQLIDFRDSLAVDEYKQRALPEISEMLPSWPAIRESVFTGRWAVKSICAR